jgi:DNA-binding IclR family transcriptional regulator
VKPAQPNNSLINGLACLQLVVTRDEPVGVRELARELKLSPTRVSRLLSTLAHLGLVSQTPRRKYQPGSAIHILAAQSLHASPLLSLALPHLMKFRQDGFTVALGVLWRRQICYLFHERPAQNIEESIGRHEVHPAERSSAGMALLAEAKADPPATLQSGIEYLNMPDDWCGCSQKIRDQGYAALRYPDGEISIGTVIGSPAVAAIAISGRHISEGFIPELAKRLRESSQAISASLNPDTLNHKA